MSIEAAVQDEIMISAMRAEVFKEVYGLLEREAKKVAECGDLQTRDYVEMLIAKLRAEETKAQRR